MTSRSLNVTDASKVGNHVRIPSLYSGEDVASNLPRSGAIPRLKNTVCGVWKRGQPTTSDIR